MFPNGCGASNAFLESKVGSAAEHLTLLVADAERTHAEDSTRQASIQGDDPTTVSRDLQGFVEPVVGSFGPAASSIAG